MFIANSIFVVLHWKIQYFETSDVIVVKKKSLLKVLLVFIILML